MRNKTNQFVLFKNQLDFGNLIYTRVKFY